MLKLVDFLKKNKIIVAVIGLLVAASGGVLFLESGELYGNKLSQGSPAYNAEILFKHKNAYVGDNSKVVTIIDTLPCAGSRGEVSLQTRTVPYGITVNYNFNGVTADVDQVKWNFRNNAVVLFSLIDNAGVIDFYATGFNGQSKYRFTRDEVQKEFQVDPGEYAKDLESFKGFLKSLVYRLDVFPVKYTPSMSSAPGIRIAAEYLGSVARVRYTANGGSLLTWDISAGNVSKGEATVELSYGIPAYWSPVEGNGQVPVGRNSQVSVELLDDKGNQIGEKKLTILYDGTFFYSVSPSSDIVLGSEARYQNRKPKDLNEAVSRAIKGERSSYGEAETAVEGHIILDTEEKNGTVKVYALASFGAFGFENGIFTKVSGSGAIPSVMVFARSDQGEYSLLEYRQPVDGAGYTDSIKEMFPKVLWPKVFLADKYPELVKQQEDQAEEYLRSIGRKAPVSAAHVEKKLVDIDVQASNRLFGEFTKYNSFLNNCPYWLGTRERIEEGVRYIYETSQSKAADGCDLIIFRKKTEEGTVVEECSYKIVGNNPQPVK